MVSLPSKRSRESDPGGAAAESPEINTVYVDTSLGTHLVVLVSSSDTVTDFKSIDSISNSIIFSFSMQHVIKLRLFAEKCIVCANYLAKIDYLNMTTLFRYD